MHQQEISKVPEVINIQPQIIRMKDIHFDPSVFKTFLTGTPLDYLLSSVGGIPKGVNYMVIGDPGVGKTTVVMDMLANICKKQPQTKALFISAEMNEIDLSSYIKRFPKFGNIDILFIEPDIDEDTHWLETLNKVLDEGWDFVAIDSFSELQIAIREEHKLSGKSAETMLLSLIKKHNKGENKSNINTTFLTIQQVTKAGYFVGSNRLKHIITSMMELRLESPKDIYSERFITFSKHRRGEVGIRLFYEFGKQDGVIFDGAKLEREKKFREASRLDKGTGYSASAKFDDVFGG